jgi:hypothetical protein
MNKMARTIIIEGDYKDRNSRGNPPWYKKDFPDNFQLDGEPILNLLNQYIGKRIKLTIEEIK